MEGKTIIEQIIGDIPYSEDNFIRVAIVQWFGQRYIDIRQVFENAQGDIVATKKGVRWRIDILPELKKLIDKACEVKSRTVCPLPYEPERSSVEPQRRPIDDL